MSSMQDIDEKNSKLSYNLFDANKLFGQDLTVCNYQVGLVMGKGGETIRNICSQSGAHCQVT